jgi:hypothetical protein
VKPLALWSRPSLSSAALVLCARFAGEGVLCRGYFLVSCIVRSSSKRVSQETVQRTTGPSAIRQSEPSLGRLALPWRPEHGGGA